jgi:hypothetical protein
MGVTTGKMAFQPNIVTNGLVLNLDAINPNSYPQSGTIWYDTSGNNNNGTLTNGTAWIPNGSQTSFSFDGVDDLVNCGNTTSILSITNQLTFGGFVKFNTFGTFRRFIFKDNGTEGVFESFYNPNVSKFDFELVTSSGRTSVRSTTTPSINTIYYLIGTYDGLNIKIYVNGVLENTVSKTGNISIGPGGGLFLGNTNGGANPYSFYLNGNIYSTQIYNRALSADEVSQNYNALKTRFGLS